MLSRAINWLSAFHPQIARCSYYALTISFTLQIIMHSHIAIFYTHISYIVYSLSHALPANLLARILLVVTSH